MGGEGHIASLFPGTEVLGEKKKLVAACFVPILGRNRMTFCYPLINAAKNVVLLVTGEDKSRAVARLLGDDHVSGEQLPAAGIELTHGKLVMVLDAAAAKQIDPKSFGQ